MIVSVASGKGGTGKTTIAVSLAAYLAGQGRKVTILDCDVEEPNVGLFLNPEIQVMETVYVPVPTANDELCDGCGKCEAMCQFSAIVLVKGKPLILKDMCHSCGGCRLVCPAGAISELNKEIGTIEEGVSGPVRYRGGKLQIGEAISPPLIRSVKKHMDSDGVVIIDSPPGTSCPVIEAASESDYAVLVTEPTPFGLNDLKLAVGMIRELAIPFGVVINRMDIGDSRIKEYCDSENITILALIPDSREVAERYSKGNFADYFITVFKKEIHDIALRITG